MLIRTHHCCVEGPHVKCLMQTLCSLECFVPFLNECGAEENLQNLFRGNNNRDSHIHRLSLLRFGEIDRQVPMSMH